MAGRNATWLVCLFLCIFGLFVEQVKSEFSFAGYYGNHMVLQKAPKRSFIWGYADIAQDAVNVTLTGFDTMTTYTEYDSQIKRVVWRCLLPSVADVTRSYTITVRSLQVTLQLTDVLFGDVWLCSGQSNMQFTLSMVFNASEEIADVVNFSDIRVFTVAPKYSDHEEHDVIVQEPWSLPSKESIGHSDWSYFSAVCWLYGKYLYQHLKYPIGLVAATWGGTPIEAWSSRTAIDICMPEQSNPLQSSIFMQPTSDPYPQNEPTVLWNAMIHPLLNMTIYGAIWYQDTHHFKRPIIALESYVKGESNTYDPDLYRCQFPVMIFDWRKQFNLGSENQTDPNFPFGFVQLAPWRNNSSITTGFPDIRWSQTAYFGYNPNPQMLGTFMAVAIDLPDFLSPYNSIHPRDKQDVASRLVLSALTVAYNKTEGRFQGPRATGYAIPKSEPVVEVFFDNGNTSINVRSTDGFELCCSNNNYSLCDGRDSEWIEAPIIGTSKTFIELRMTGICQTQWIMGVRYAWRESPCSFKKCAIYSDGNSLPMGPFKYNSLIGRFVPDGETIY